MALYFLVLGNVPIEQGVFGDFINFKICRSSSIPSEGHIGVVVARACIPRIEYVSAVSKK